MECLPLYLEEISIKLISIDFKLLMLFDAQACNRRVTQLSGSIARPMGQTTLPICVHVAWMGQKTCTGFDCPINLLKNNRV